MADNKSFGAMGANFQSDRASKAVKIANGSVAGPGTQKLNGQSSSSEKAPKAGKIAARKESKPNVNIKSSTSL